MTRCVMVTKFLPLPADSGGKQRSLAIARRLAERTALTLVAHDDGRADVEGLTALGITVRAVPWRPRLGTIARGTVATGSLSAGRFWSKQFVREVRQATTPAPDLLLVVYSQLSPLLVDNDAGVKVLDLQNVESELAASYAAVARRPQAVAARLESVALRRLERRALVAADAVSVVSDQDAHQLPGAARRVLVCPNGIDPGDAEAPAEAPIAAFVALLGWRPNAEAALWVTRMVWPKVLDRVPDARLLLVGRDPTPAVQALACQNVEVTGSVPSVSPYLRRARVALAPLLSGGGTRLKILEALVSGRPVVATTVGAEGLEDLVGSGVVTADEPDEMAARLSELLTSPHVAEDLGRRGRAAVIDRYNWDRTLAPLLELVE